VNRYCNTLLLNYPDILDQVATLLLKHIKIITPTSVIGHGTLVPYIPIFMTAKKIFFILRTILSMSILSKINIESTLTRVIIKLFSKYYYSEYEKMDLSLHKLVFAVQIINNNRKIILSKLRFVNYSSRIFPWLIIYSF